MRKENTYGSPSVAGDPCGHCGVPVARKTHKAGWVPKPSARHYYSEWLNCSHCKSTWLNNDFRVSLDPPSDIEEMDRHLRDIRPTLPLELGEACEGAGSASNTSVRGKFQRVLPISARATAEGVELDLGSGPKSYGLGDILIEGNLLDGTAVILLRST